MKTFELFQLTKELQDICSQISLLEFWKGHPEIKLISITYTCEYDDGCCCPSLFVKHVTLFSEKAEQGLVENLSFDKKTEVDWDKVVGLTGIDLPPIDRIYVRPENLEAQIVRLKQQAEEYLSSSSLLE